MPRHWMMPTVAAAGLLVVAPHTNLAQQTAPAIPPQSGPTMPAAPRPIPPAEYALMREILNQMLQQAENEKLQQRSNRPALAEPPLNCPAAPKPQRIPPAGGTESHTSQQPSMSSSIIITPSAAAATHDMVPQDATAAFLGSWQRKTDLICSTLHIRPDHLYLEVEISAEGLNVGKVGITADYVILKDRRTVLCYVTGFDLDGRTLTRNNDRENFTKTLLELQRVFVETAFAVKVAMYEDAFVISSVRLPLLAERDETTKLILQLFAGRYERLAPAAVRK